MLVLQDFEALTPNLLARTVETVEGGGLVVLLLSQLDSLTRLYELTMDAHARLRTAAGGAVVPRFNERLVLSLAGCTSCLLLDDELNVLPTSSAARDLAALPAGHQSATSANSEALAALREGLRDAAPAGPLTDKCRTLCQARALVAFLDAAGEKTLRSTVALTAGRGRGKSAALGLSVAGALGLGYSNIFITAPSPENVRTLFEFLFVGLDALGYKEHLDYDLIESTSPAFGRSIVRVNIYRDHRQTVQYIQPGMAERLGQCELLVIDEAAAIPLPTVRSLLGPYLVFLASTVSGYEGTGRSLSLKLLSDLRARATQGGGGCVAGTSAGAAGRTFREATLEEPIRYAPGCAVERWLSDVLCLDAARHLPPPPGDAPHPSACDLWRVDRDTLFSGHPASEAFLQRCQALMVASHYRNSPDDLLLLADAPAHRLFVLLAPVDASGEASGCLPDILCVVQVALEGAVSRPAVLASLAAGTLPAGDLVPWTVAQQYQDPDFPGLSGARVVRIASHPGCLRAGYGKRTLEQLAAYLSGELAGLTEAGEDGGDGAAAGGSGSARRSSTAAGVGSDDDALHTECLAPRQNLPPLLSRAADDPRPPRLHWLAASFGLSPALYSFWRRAGCLPLYLRQTPNEATGEHTCVMLRALANDDVEGTGWAEPFTCDFRRRLLATIGGPFRGMSPSTALTLLDPKINFTDEETRLALAEGAEADASLEAETENHVGELGTSKAGAPASPSSAAARMLPPVVRVDGRALDAHDLRRLKAHADSLADYRMVLDLVGPLARAFFAGRLPTSLSYGQAALLLAVGLQGREADAASRELGLTPSQGLALLGKALRKMHAYLAQRRWEAAARRLPARPSGHLAAEALATSVPDLDEELSEGAAEATEEMRVRLDPDDLARFAVGGAAGGNAAGGKVAGKNRDRGKGAKRGRRDKGGGAGKKHARE